MPWFESSKEKQFRQLIESKMEICLTKPDKYDQAFPVLDSFVRKPNQKAIEMIVNHIKQVIKEDEFEPAQKLRAMILLRDLMTSQSKPLGKYVVVKILKRLTILAQHRKNEKDQNRGANIFKCKKSEEKYGIEFLKVLLLCLSDWGKNWPRHADGPFHDFQSAYNDLLLQKQVTFPMDEKKLSKSPVPKVNKNSKQDLSSPPKKPSSTPAPPNEKMIANRLSKPVIKQKEPVTGILAEYFNSMIEISNLLSSTLSENPEFGEIWGIIKAYVDQFKTVDEQGNLIVAQMIESGNQNEQILQAIQGNSDFIAQLVKDTRTVDNKNESYGKYNGKYVKRCKKIVLSLSIFVDKPNSSSLNNNNASATFKVPAETSMNEKVQQIPQPEKPKAEFQKNRYGSSNQLRKNLQLNLNPVKKQDFNSGTLNKHNENSEASSRYNSVTGNQLEKNRFSGTSHFNEMKEKQKEAMQQKKQSQGQKTKPEEKILDFFAAATQSKETKKELKKQISKISEQNENQSTINKFDFQKDVPKNQKDNKVNELFGQFQAPPEKRESSNSNSQFFKDLQNQKGKIPAPKTRDRNKKAPNKNSPIPQPNDFFNISVKSKLGQNMSGFQRSKETSQQIKQNQNSHQNSQLKAFDTFKSPNQIAQAMKELRKSQEDERRSQRSAVSNPFEKPNTYQQNPFAVHFGQNSFHKSQKSQKSFDNPFAARSENPFETKYEERKEDNPFATKMQEKQQGQQQNKSKSSNPFSAKHTPSQKSQQKSSIKSKPPMPKRKSDTNPFDTKSYHSRKNDQVQKQKPNLNNSLISNPFENAEKKSMQQSLSQRGSFLNAKNIVGSVKNPSNVIENPFDVEQTKKDLVEDRKDKSFQGFNFDDFMNVSGQKSQSKSKQNKPEKQLNQSGFHFSDFGDVKNSQHQKSSSFAVNNFFQQTNKLPEKQNSFNLFPNAENENKAKVQNFFQTSKQSKNSNGNNSNFFETSKEEKNVSKAEKIRNKTEGHQLGFDDFPNMTQSKPAKNPFLEFDQSKQSQPSKIEAVQKPSLNNLEQSWSKIGKKSVNEQSDEWKKFANIAEKQSQQSKSNRSEKQSQYEPSQPEDKPIPAKQLPWMIEQKANEADKNENTDRVYDEYQNNEPKFGNSEKSISIHFDEPSPFQKKQIPWQFTHAALPSSTRYNIGPEAIRQKRQVLIQVQLENKDRIENYNEVNERLNKLRKQYATKIEKLGEVRQQKNEFVRILNRLKETNQLKQREIEDLIKKKLRAQQIKSKILEKERFLHERMKNQRMFRDQELASKERIGNKWERFNQNLKKQKQIAQLEKTASHFSYYA